LWQQGTAESNFFVEIRDATRFGSQVVAAKRLKIREAKLSYLVRGHAAPNPEEREILKAALGIDCFEPDGPKAA
jgi:hypothetical protein